MYSRSPDLIYLTKLKVFFQKEQRRRRERESLVKEITTENSSKFGREMNMWIYDAQRTPNRLNIKRSSPEHSIIKLSKIKDKERILKLGGEN